MLNQEPDRDGVPSYFNTLSLPSSHASSITTAMDLPSTWSQTCICGHTFLLPQAYTFHTCSCQKTKKRLASALEKAKESWQAKKRQKTEGNAFDPSNMDAVPEPVPNEAPQEVRFLF